ncbi:MAG: SDR family oxidoreductase [Candidatus Hydrogenedentes bacterium]|nr:SDR family oxidoreductase [Candidatus Hydrogenedentota bacterium]
MSEKRTAFVTGGGGGIGRAICESLAAAGRRVAVADLAVDRAQAVAEGIGGLAVELDVTDPASVESAVACAVEGLGPIDILVNCAGWDEFKPFVETDDAFLHKVLAINLAGPMRMTRTILPGMIERNWGRIVNIASDAGRVGSSMEAIYSGAKGGLIAFTKTIAREVARKGITANSICPGPTETPMLAGVTGGGADGEKVLAAMARAVPMKRLGRPEDIGPAVAFFASEEAGYITGQTLSVSGGLTMM